MATGRGVPAAFDRATGEFQYLHLQANTRLGGADIVLSDSSFINNGYVFDQEAGATGQKLGIGPAVATPDGLVCSVKDKRLEFKWENLEKFDRRGNPFTVRGVKQSFSTEQPTGTSAVVALDKIVVGSRARSPRCWGNRDLDAGISGTALVSQSPTDDCLSVPIPARLIALQSGRTVRGFTAEPISDPSIQRAFCGGCQRNPEPVQHQRRLLFGSGLR